MLLSIAPPAIVFSGFASNTLWLVFGGLIVAEAAAATGLGRRLAALLLRSESPSYARLVTLTVSLATALAFVMPATLGRILLLLPVVSEVAAHAGLRPGARMPPCRPGQAPQFALVTIAFASCSTSI